MGNEATKIALELNNEDIDAEARVEELEDEVCMLKDRIKELEDKLKQRNNPFVSSINPSAYFQPARWGTGGG